MRLYKDTQHSTVSNTFLLNIMSKTIALALLERANNGEQLLQILDSLVEDIAPSFDYIESPTIEQALGIPTLEPIAF